MAILFSTIYYIFLASIYEYKRDSEECGALPRSLVFRIAQAEDVEMLHPAFALQFSWFLLNPRMELAMSEADSERAGTPLWVYVNKGMSQFRSRFI